jgi:hypothetical protein
MPLAHDLVDRPWTHPLGEGRRGIDSLRVGEEIVHCTGCVARDVDVGVAGTDYAG